MTIGSLILFVALLPRHTVLTHVLQRRPRAEDLTLFALETCLNRNMLTPRSRYMFFLVPDDLTNLDIVNGQCYNSSIKQNVTFSEQGLPFGLSKKSAAGRQVERGLNEVAVVGLVMVFVMFFGAL